MKKNIFKSLIGIAIGAIFLYFTLNNKPLGQIFESLKSAKINWLLFSVLWLIASFYLRAFRWKVLLESSDTNPLRYNVIHSLIVGYLVNSFTPKFGEIIRCTSLKKSEKIPTSISLGTVVSERIYDLLVLFTGLGVIFLIEIDRLGSIIKAFFSGIGSIFSRNALAGIGIIILVIIAIYALIWLSKRNKLAAKIKDFLSKMLMSLKSSIKMKKYKEFILLTIAIWIVLILAYYSLLMSLPQTNSFGLYFAIVVLFVGSVGWAIPSPSGIGTSNFMILQLFVAFSLNEQAGVSFGLLASGITFSVTVILGSLALIYHFFRQRRLAPVNEDL
jgi:glycosyltransferase 2 family protein